MTKKWKTKKFFKKRDGKIPKNSNLRGRELKIEEGGGYDFWILIDSIEIKI